MAGQTKSIEAKNLPVEAKSAGVHDNVRNLGLDALDILNYRVMGSGHGPKRGPLVHCRAGDGCWRTSGARG